jgi:hypothetical protein
MRKTQSQRSAPASKDLIIDFASTREIESLRRTQCYETQINALTLENAKLNEEHESLKNDMVALSHECGELELECSLERSVDEQLRSTIEALSYKCEELLVRESQKHKPSNETIGMQQMKQKLKNAAKERILLEERVTALERESAETDYYICVLERNNTSEWRSTRWTLPQNDQEDPRSSKSLSDLPQLFLKRHNSLRNTPSADNAEIIKEERKHRRASLDSAVKCCTKFVAKQRRNQNSKTVT